MERPSNSDASTEKVPQSRYRSISHGQTLGDWELSVQPDPRSAVLLGLMSRSFWRIAVDIGWFPSCPPIACAGAIDYMW